MLSVWAYDIVFVTNWYTKQDSGTIQAVFTRKFEICWFHEQTWSNQLLKSQTNLQIKIEYIVFFNEKKNYFGGGIKLFWMHAWTTDSMVHACMYRTTESFQPIHKYSLQTTNTLVYILCIIRNSDDVNQWKYYINRNLSEWKVSKKGCNVIVKKMHTDTSFPK